MKLHEYDPKALPGRDLAKLYRALAHPVRLHILYLLSHEEMCVCHLTCLLYRPQPYVSQQLGILRDAGLVSDRRDGKTVSYRVADPLVAGLIALGQQLLEHQGKRVEFPLSPKGPIRGCSCPRCSQES